MPAAHCMAAHSQGIFTERFPRLRQTLHCDELHSRWHQAQASMYVCVCSTCVWASVRACVCVSLCMYVCVCLHVTLCLFACVWNVTTCLLIVCICVQIHDVDFIPLFESMYPRTPWSNVQVSPLHTVCHTVSYSVSYSVTVTHATHTHTGQDVLCHKGAVSCCSEWAATCCIGPL